MILAEASQFKWPTHAAGLLCRVKPLTSFNGGVNGGHVRLFIFHNCPVKTQGGPTHTYTHLSRTHANTQTNHRRLLNQSVLNSTYRH